MPAEDQSFLERLARAPAGLLLGQSHLALGAASDPLLDLLNRKLGVEQPLRAGYDVLFNRQASGDGASLLDWIDEKCRLLAVSEHMDVISEYAWIGVWSSAVDSLWADSFEHSWREVQKVLTESYRPADPRNRRRLHCTFLFGSANRSDPDERPPLTLP